MSPLVFVAVCVAGGVGAALRFVLDGAIRARFPMMFPLGTAVINVSGSFVLGAITGLALAAVLPEEWTLVLGTGVMGGYTTFSTASIETMRLIEEREYVLALTNGLGVLVAAVVAGLAGLWLGSAF